MPRVTLTKTVPAGPIPLTALTAVTWTAADPVNDEQIVLTQKDILIIWNSGASTRNFILTAVADTLGRTTNIGESIAAGVMKCCIPGFEGFRQSGGYLYLEADHADIKYAVLTFP